jgi:hypothetical protein
VTDADRQAVSGICRRVFVLLAMRLLAMFGLMALGLAADGGMMSQMNRMMNGDAGGSMLSMFVVWVALVVMVILTVIALMIRQGSRA